VISLKILITNTVTLNGGDAAILHAIIYLLHDIFGNNTEFIIYDNQPEEASRYYPNLNFRKLLYLSKGCRQLTSLLYKLRLGRIAPQLDLMRFYSGAWCIKHHLHHIARLFLNKDELQDLIEYSSADLIVSTGGTYLVENYNFDQRIFDYNLSLYFKAPLVFFTQSLGPFHKTTNRAALKPIFEKSLLVLLRDKRSLNNLVDLGVKNVNAYVATDAAFALADPNIVAIAKNNSTNSAPLKVAISVREWKHFKTVDPVMGKRKYFETLQALTIHLVEKYNARVTYISTCQGILEYWTDDSQIALKIVETLPDRIKKSIRVNTDFHSPEDFVKIMQGFDLMIATRMHAAILALGAGVPVLPIAYEFKTQELFKRLGQGQSVQDIENITPETLIDAADDFINVLPQFRKELFSRVEQERKCALKSGMMVKKAFEEWQNSSNS
jgi:colanic acid/amylovoran biosynthesis protein